MLSMSSPPSQPSGPVGPLSGAALLQRVPWGAVTVFTASLLYLLFYYRFPISDADEGIVATGAERILRGQVPYRDFFSELGPASFYFQVLIFRVTGINVSSLRLTAWLLGGVLSLLIYLLGRRFLRGSDTFVPPLIFTMICYPYSYRVSHHSWGNLFLCICVLCLSRLAFPFPKESTLRLKAYVFCAGASAAVTLLAMQPKGAWAMAMGVVFLSLYEGFPAGNTIPTGFRKGLVWNLWFILGVAAVIGPVMLYFIKEGALGSWARDNVIFLFANYRPYLDVPQASPWGIISHTAWLAVRQPSVHIFLYGMGYLFFLTVGPGIAFGYACWRVFLKRSRAEPQTGLLLLFLLQGLGAYFSNWHAPDNFHLMSAAPLMLILLIYTFRCGQDSSWRLRRPLRVVAWAGLMLMCFTGLRRAGNILQINAPVQTRRGTIYVPAGDGLALQQVINTIQDKVPPGGETFFFPYHAELYFLTSTYNPTRYDVLLADFHSVRQIDVAISTLRAKRPAWIFDLSRRLPWTIRPHFPDDQPDVLGPHRVEQVLLAPMNLYTPASEVADMQVWALKR